MSRANRTPVLRLQFGERSSQPLLKSRRMWGGILLGLLVFAASPVHQAQAQSGPPGSGWVLTFDEEFQGSSLDRSKWNYVSWYGNQVSFSDSNVVEGNGSLQILTQQSSDGSYTTGGIATLGGSDLFPPNTSPLFLQLYGWWEIRCQLPRGTGLDYACCLYNGVNEPYGEIDIFEQSFWKSANGGVLPVDHATVRGADLGGGEAISYPSGFDFSQFHTYAVNWQPGLCTFYIDGIQTFQTTFAVPQVPMGMLINNGGGVVNGPGIVPSPLPASMVVEYVRVYQGGGTTPPSNIKLSASPASVSPGGTVTASWTAPSGQTSAEDWVGLYQVGSPDSSSGTGNPSHLTWQYTGGSTSGSLSFTAPAASGSYEYRYFLNNTYTRAATSNTVTVRNTPPPPNGNLIQDPAYTQQTQGDGNPLIAPWSGTGPALIGLDSKDGNGPWPTPCGYIYDPGTGAWSAITQTVPVIANTNYTLSAMIQTSSPFPGGSLGAWAPDGRVLGEQAFAEQDNYTQVTVSFNSGSATNVTVYAGFTGYSGMAAWIHADNWSMVDPPGLSSSTSGASTVGGLSSAQGSGGKGACGLTGLETILVLGVLALRRRQA